MAGPPEGTPPPHERQSSEDDDISEVGAHSQAAPVAGSAAAAGESGSPPSSRSSSDSEEPASSGGTDIHALDANNPLQLFSDSGLARAVGDLADIDEGLKKHRELLICGAQLARDHSKALGNNTDFSRHFLKGLEKEQKIYLQQGKEREAGFWGQSKYLKGSLLSACLAGIIQGWTQSAMNGANVGITDQFDIHYKPNDLKRSTGDLWVFGILNATPFLAGGLLAPFISDPFQEHFIGRRGALAVACLISIAATLGQSFSKSIAQLVGCRVISGLALAAKASTAPLLTAEVAPNHLRGNLLSTWQLSDAFGIFLGFSSNLATLNMSAKDTIIWRVQLATTLIPVMILLFVVYWMPESPRFLMKKGEHPKALESFTLVRPSPVSALLAARDFVYAHFQLETECKSMEKRRNAKKPPIEDETTTGESLKDDGTTDLEASKKKVDSHTKNEQEDQAHAELPRKGKPAKTLYDIRRTNYFQRLSQTFKDGRSRRALLCASTAMISQQLCGINTIAFLSASLLKDIASPRAGAWLGFGVGLCNFLFGTPAFWLLDRVGRATMLLFGFLPMFVLLLIVAFSFKGGTKGDARVPLVGVFGILFVIAYSPTAGTSPFAISAEVFPLIVREVGHSLAVAVNFVGLGIVLLVFPSLSDAMGGYRGSLSLFAALNLVAFVLCFLFVPETKGRTLEELRIIFDIPTKTHVNYRVKYVAPWLAKKYLRPWAVKLHLWRKPVSDSVEYGFVEFHDWAKSQPTES